MAQPYAQKTLFPGQVINVNKHSVQVERYLSQGGFAHVYLVTTSVPVFDTNRHVLKRIAVPNESMLAEVKKEVDFMRLFRGHPNIVRLIDATTFRTSSGVYEVFILMEYCPGGGIIDMMNRRLRERLTEAEILQIFVDICEGVAAMHNLRPPVLHRDLKVENILQSSQSSYKICDFGSATVVALRPPSSIQEIRALEADLNRHTTLQYRAPEMVDPYLRRPIDEKSDVWALGVLLYKLCYYTTPFEEHGPLAILNCVYRIPPYPVYSDQMQAIIRSMLQEHGSQRPHVFELLTLVHRLRGTKPRYTYTVPELPPLSPRSLRPLTSAVDPAKNLTPYNSAPSSTIIPASVAGVKSQGIAPEAVATVRKGRVASNRNSEVVSNSRVPEQVKEATQLFDGGDEAKERKPPNAPDAKWQPPAAVQSASDASKAKGPSKPAFDDDAWHIRGPSTKGTEASNGTKLALSGFGDDFASQQFWAPVWTSTTAAAALPSPAPAPAGKPVSLAVHPAPPKPSEKPRGSGPTTPTVRVRDAFEGLGLVPPVKLPAPTLGEARKLRTGIAVVYGKSQRLTSDTVNNAKGVLTPKHTPPLVASPSGHRMASSTSRFLQPSPRSSASHAQLSAEARFPSVEELDATFAAAAESTQLSRPSLSPSHSGLQVQPLDGQPMSPSTLPGEKHATVGSRPPPSPSGVNTSEHSPNVTTNSEALEFSKKPAAVSPVDERDARTLRRPLPSKERRTRGESTKIVVGPDADLLGVPSLLSPAFSGSSGTPSALQTTKQSKDWLCGSEDELPPRDNISPLAPSPYKAVLRGSPGKRAALELPSEQTESPQEAVTHQTSPLRMRLEASPALTRSNRSTVAANETTPRAAKTEPRNPSPRRSDPASQSNWKESDSSADEGPEDAHGYVPPIQAGGQTPRRRPRGKQTSVHELVDLWGGGVKDASRPSPSPVPAETGPPATPRKQASVYAAPSSSVTPKPSQPQKLFALDPASNSSPRRSRLSQSSKVANLTPTLSPATPTSRPQSMFVFPMSKSKSEEHPLDPSPVSPGLVSPAEPKKHVARRTSISDMVQLYEAIDGKAKGQATKSVDLKPITTTLASEDPGQYTRARAPSSPTRSKTTIRPSVSPASLAPDGAALGVGRFRRSPTGSSASPTTPIRTKEPKEGSNTSSGIQNRTAKPEAQLPATRPSTPANKTLTGYPPSMPARRSSTDHPPSIPARRSSTDHPPSMPARRSSTEAPPSSPAKKSLSEAPPPTHTRKPLAEAPSSMPAWKPLTEAPSPKPVRTRLMEERPPSPEKPYQGVGKLISQWQQKTAGVDSSHAPPPPRRSRFVPKRSDALNDDLNRSH